MKRLLLLAIAMMALASPGTAAASTCTTTVSSVASAVSAVGAAAPGSTICLTDGTYGQVSITANKSAPGVTLQAEHPGNATIAGAVLDGSNITIAQFHMTGTWEARPGSSGMTADHNSFDLNAYTGFGIMACASDTTTCNDVTVSNNRFIGLPEEDVIRANRYHDANGDGRGLAVVHNEFAGNTERGDHNDVFQSVWVGDHLVFSNNYLHDFGGQGFFVKDQASAIDGLVAEDNLIINQDLPCQPASLCPGFQLSPYQIFGPVTNVSMRHNTVGWSSSGSPDGGFGVLTGSYSNAVFSDNVFNALGVTNSGGTGTNTTGSGNSRCTGNGWPAPTGTADGVCSPSFLDPANGDYRLASGAGVTWRVADQQFGPSGSVTPPPPPPPADSDGDGVPDSSDACPGTPAGTAVDATGCPVVTPPPPPVDHKPVARFTRTPSSPRRGQRVTFDGRSSTCVDTPCLYRWVDDGSDGIGGSTYALGTGSVLRFTFHQAGKKFVRLRVTDADGDVAYVSHTVTVRS